MSAAPARGLALFDRRDVIVQDEIESAQPVDFAWHIHTEANVDIDGRRATLSHGDRRLFVEILEPADARLSVAPSQTQPPQRPIEHVQRLSITMPQPVRELRLVVLLTPDEQAAGAAERLGPLTTWPDHR